MDILELAKRHHALERVDGTGDTFRRRARILQSMWREEQGYPCGTHRGRPLGSRLPMPWAEETLANYMSPTIQQVVRDEVLESRERGRLFGRPRIFDDLLSSQPLCFNLFGELQGDLDARTVVMSEMTGGRVVRVTRLAFEYSPGRGDDRYTGDRSAFDVYVEYEGGHGRRGFLGIEVKYHEDLKGVAADHRGRYDVVAEEMGCFRRDARDALLRQPLQQVWRDHLLAGSILNRGEFDEGCFVFLHPAGNRHCADAVGGYTACLTADETFAVWTLENLVATIRRHVAAPWVDAVWDRYLDFGKIDQALGLNDGGAVWPGASSPRPFGRAQGRSSDVSTPSHGRKTMSAITTADFLADSTGRCFRDVVEGNPGLFERIVAFFDDADRQRRMIEATTQAGRPALAGVVVELERQPWFDSHMTSTPADDTKRLRRAIGVFVRVVMESQGFRKTGRKGSLKTRRGIPEGSGPSRWLGSAEIYELHDAGS